MRRFYTFLALGATVASAFAVQSPLRLGATLPAESLRVPCERNLSRASSLTSDDFTGEIVTEAPAGDTRHYSGASRGISNVFGVKEAPVDGAIADLTFTADGKVYWLNPLSSAPFGSYIVGDIKDNKITFKMPQHLHDEDYGFMVYQMFATMMEVSISDDGKISYAPADDQTLELTLNADGTITQSETSAMLVLSDWDIYDEKLYFDGYGDGNYVLTLFDDQPVVVPADVKFDNWVINEDYNEYKRWLVKVGFDGNDVYIKDLDPTFPEWTIKGVLSGDKISFAADQYLGTAYYRYNYAVNATIEYVYDPDRGREVGYVVKADGPFVLDYDAAAKCMTAPNRDCTLVFNEGRASISANRVIVNPIISDQGALESLDPLMPEDLKAEYNQADEQVGLRFTSPCVNDCGQLFDPVLCSYEMYVDGELFTFEAGVYPRLTETMTEIPYTFTDSYDIQYIAGTDYHYVYFYGSDMKSLGVRMIYTDPADGSKHYSPIASLDIDFSGIEDVKADSNAPAEYFNLQGVRVDNPAAGLYIRRQGNDVTKIMIK